MGNDGPFESSDSGKHCGVCQHCVEVPGLQQIVCLAFLSVRQPEPGVFCSEFEVKSRSPLSLVEN